MAPKRSFVAGSTPPNNRSQTSVVVMSMTPASSPLSASFSIERPRVHAGGDDRGAAAAAEADHAGVVVAGLDEASKRNAHAGNGGAAIVDAEHRAGSVRMVRRDFACRNIHRYGGAARADIDAG